MILREEGERLLLFCDEMMMGGMWRGEAHQGGIRLAPKGQWKTTSTLASYAMVGRRRIYALLVC